MGENTGEKLVTTICIVLCNNDIEKDTIEFEKDGKISDSIEIAKTFKKLFESKQIKLEDVKKLVIFYQLFRKSGIQDPKQTHIDLKKKASNFDVLFNFVKDASICALEAYDCDASLKVNKIKKSTPIWVYKYPKCGNVSFLGNNEEEKCNWCENEKKVKKKKRKNP